MSRLPKAVLFDLDGTLVDSAEDIIAAADAALKPLGIAAPRNVLMRNVGYGGRAMIQDAIQDFSRGRDAPAPPFKGDQFEAILRQFLEAYQADIAKRTRPFNGAKDLLAALKEKDVRLAVCTNKFEALARKLLDAFNMSEFFDYVAGGDTFARKKPDPDHPLLILEALGIEPERAALIGDSEPDVVAAKTARMKAVVVKFGYETKPLDSLGADAIIDSFADLMPLFESGRLDFSSSRS